MAEEFDQEALEKATAVTSDYGEEQIQVLEGLEAEEAGHVHRLHGRQRPASPGLRNCRQFSGRSPGRLLQGDRRYAESRRKRDGPG